LSGKYPSDTNFLSEEILLEWSSTDLAVIGGSVEGRLIKPCVQPDSAQPSIAAPESLLFLMKSDSSDSFNCQPLDSELAVYSCEIHLKFRLIEDKNIPRDREQLLEILLDAFSYCADEYLEPLQAHAEVVEVSEIEASPEMRRQLIRLRNSKDSA
jgi:Npun R1517